MPNPLIHSVTEKLTDGQWAGQRCFVIGGGPSMRGFRWELLENENVIGINKAFITGVCDIVIAGDRRFWEIHAKDPRLNQHPLPVYADSSHGWLHQFPIYRLNTKSMFYWGDTLAEGVGAGPDTGYRAVNLADILGASPIYLLGFDMQGGDDGKQIWWHDGYGPRRQKNQVYKRFARGYQLAVDHNSIRGDVLNLSPRTALEAFPRGSLADVFPDERIWNEDADVCVVRDT